MVTVTGRGSGLGEPENRGQASHEGPKAAPSMGWDPDDDRRARSEGIAFRPLERALGLAVAR